MRGPVAYISQFYPHLTETFVYREVLGLREHGLDVRTFACWSPDRERLSAESLPLVDETGYVFPLAVGRFVANHLRALATAPLRYLGTLAWMLTRRGESLKNRGFSILHFAMAVHLAPSMRRMGIAHIHAQFSINAATIALVLSRLYDIPFSFTAHNLLFTKQMLLGEKVRHARFIVAISDYTRRVLVDSAPPGVDPSDRIHVVHCGLSTEAFVPGEARDAESRESETASLLFVAQLQERKGVTVLVEACGELAARGTPFECTIVGDGPDYAAARELVRDLKLEDRVTLTGALPQERLPAHLERADVFVLPCVETASGDLDGIPVALMEAMACGIPVVSTRVSGIPELIEDGVTGALVDSRDSGQLADALGRLIGDARLRRRLGRAGREYVRERFEIRGTSAELARLFERYATACS